MAKNISSKEALFEDFSFPNINAQTSESKEQKDAPVRVRKTKAPAEKAPAVKKAAAPATQTVTRTAKVKATDPRNKQSEKVTYYLTPRIYEALQVYKKTRNPFDATHNDSRMVNALFEEVLAKELAVLDSLDPALELGARMRKAMNVLTSDNLD